MSRGEIIMKSRRILAGLMTVLPWIPNTACATSSDVKMPPGFTVKWNIEPKDSVVEQDFVVTEYRVYRFEIKFSSIRKPISGEEIEELNRIYKFTGDGRSQCYTKESVNTDHPVVVPANTPEEFNRRAEGVQKGIYVWKADNPGVIVPVHIRIEQVDSAGATTVHADKLVNTENIEGAVAGGLIRLIAEVKLRPGKYRLSARTVRESPLLPNMETFLRAAAIPKSGVLKDSQ